MAHATVSKAEESSHQQTKNQDNGHLFFDPYRVAHEEFVSPGVTVNHKYYCEALHCLKKRVMRVGMEIADDWIPRASSLQRSRTCSIVSS
jgi:hypothetical protein